jgi:CheY-like chemotaxis protein
MAKMDAGSAVQRFHVFILRDGSFVVHWDENQVQDLLTGRYREYSEADFGHQITDYELSQLCATGHVEHYDGDYVWLEATPDPTEQAGPRASRSRAYYLNTTLPKSDLATVEATLKTLGLDHEFLARNRGGLVAVLGKNGAPFRTLEDAERAHRQLVSMAQDLFKHTAVAFVEASNEEERYQRSAEHTIECAESDLPALDDLDRQVTEGKSVVLVSDLQDEQQAIQDALDPLGLKVFLAETAAEGLRLLEDLMPDLLIMDLTLADMHGWEMLAKAKEIFALRSVPVVVIANHRAAADERTFALTVVQVDTYLVRPVSMIQLRNQVWLTLKNASPAR